MPIELESLQLFGYGQIIFSLLIVLLLGLLIHWLARRGLHTLHQKNYISGSLQGVLQVVVRWTVIIFVLLLGLQQVGVQLTSVWAAISAVIVFAGVGLIAVWSVLSNALCSLLLLVFRPFNIGDEVEIIEATGGQGLRGKVVNLNMIYTYILEEDKNDGAGSAVVQVPNNIFFQKTIRRWRGLNTKRLEETIFEDDMESVKQNSAL